MSVVGGHEPNEGFSRVDSMSFVTPWVWNFIAGVWVMSFPVLHLELIVARVHPLLEFL